MGKPTRSTGNRIQVPIPALILFGCLAIAFLIFRVYGPSGDQPVQTDQSGASSASTSQAVPSSPANPIGQASTSQTVVPNNHPVGVRGQDPEPQNGDRQAIPLPEDAPDKDELQLRLGQVASAYYGRDALEVVGYQNQGCASVPDDPSPDEVDRVREQLKPLDAQLQQLRDARLDALVADGVINDAGPNETPVLNTLKSDLIEKDWLTRCTLFSSDGVITAALDLDRWQSTIRPDRGDGIYRVYTEVPVQLTLEMRKIATIKRLDTDTLILRTEWYHQDGHWVMMSYTPN